MTRKCANWCRVQIGVEHPLRRVTKCAQSGGGVARVLEAAYGKNLLYFRERWIDYVIGEAGITLFRSNDYFVRSTTLHIGSSAVSTILPA